MNNFFEGKFVATFDDQALPDSKEAQSALLFWAPSQAPLSAGPMAFLNNRYGANGKAPSPSTWAETTQALRTWLEYLEANGKQRRDAMRDGRFGRVQHVGHSKWAS